MSATEYVLLASVFYQRQQDGKRVRYRKGDVVTGLSDSKAHRLLKVKAIAYPGDIESAGVESEVAGEPGAADDGKPAEDALKANLVDWVLANALKGDGGEYTGAELNRLTKDDLWALINSVPDETD